MNQKGNTVTLLIFGIIVILIIVVIYLSKIRVQGEPAFPSTPTQQQRDDAKKLPKSQCGCWDGVSNVCLPQADCI